MRKLKIFCRAVHTEADATLGRCCSDLLFFLNTDRLVFGGGEEKKGLGINHMDVAYSVYKTNT